MLKTSEHMLWIQSMPRVPYAYLQMPIGWIWLVMPFSVYVHIHLGIGYFKARDVKKDSIPDITMIELTNTPVKRIQPANEECIGETLRSLGERYREHLKQPSPIYVHIQQTGQNSTPDNFNILGREHQGLTRTIKEAICIRVSNPTLDRNIGKFNHNHIWDRVLLNISGFKIANPQVYVHIHTNRHNQPNPTNGHLKVGIGALWACSEFRAHAQWFLASINKYSNARLSSDLMKFTAVKESLSWNNQKFCLEKNHNVT